MPIGFVLWTGSSSHAHKLTHSHMHAHARKPDSAILPSALQVPTYCLACRCKPCPSCRSSPAGWRQRRPQRQRPRQPLSQRPPSRTPHAAPSGRRHHVLMAGGTTQTGVGGSAILAPWRVPRQRNNGARRAPQTLQAWLQARPSRPCSSTPTRQLCLDLKPPRPSCSQRTRYRCVGAAPGAAALLLPSRESVLQMSSLASTKCCVAHSLAWAQGVSPFKVQTAHPKRMSPGH